MKYNVPVQSLIDHIKTAIDVDPWAKEMAEELLKEQEAKAGKWIEQEDYNLDTYYDCSMCGNSWSTVEGTPWENGMNYCPHCGARMESIIYADGERKDSNE